MFKHIITTPRLEFWCYC